MSKPVSESEIFLSTEKTCVQTFMIRKVILVQQWQCLKLWPIAKINSRVIKMYLKYLFYEVTYHT